MTPSSTSRKRRRHDAFAVCSPGLEAIVATELADLGVTPGNREKGGVSFAATTRQLYASNLWLRCATRVVVRIAEFHAERFDELESHARRVAWADYLAPGSHPEFRVTATKSRLHHTGAIAERLTDAVAAQVGIPIRDPDALSGREQLFVVRNLKDRMTISADCSGESLFKRGWRQEVTRAALRETLAAAALHASGWDQEGPLLDPFCGSGTIAIEGAIVARGRAPGRDREFAFGRWPAFEAGTWASVAGEARSLERPAPGGVIIASDRDEGAVEIARHNAERAGVADDIEFRHAAISDLDPPEGATGWLVTDPPHGGRLDADAGGDLRNLYARLGAVVRERVPGWTIGLLVGDRSLVGHTRLTLAEAFATTSGGRDVIFLRSSHRPAPEPDTDHRGSPLPSAR